MRYLIVELNCGICVLFAFCTAVSFMGCSKRLAVDETGSCSRLPKQQPAAVLSDIDMGYVCQSGRELLSAATALRLKGGVGQGNEHSLGHGYRAGRRFSALLPFFCQVFLYYLVLYYVRSLTTGWVDIPQPTCLALMAHATVAEAT